MSLRLHLKELKYRVLISFSVWIVLSFCCYFFYDFFIFLLLNPFSEIDTLFSDKLYVSSIFEGFFTKLKCSLFFGFITAFPFLLFHFLRFIFPALKGHERRFLFLLIFPSFALSLLGIYLMYFIILPYTIPLLTSSVFVPDNIGLLLHFHDSIFYIIQFIFLAMLLFQFPILLLILIYFNCFTYTQLFKFSRYVVVFIFIASAFLTPPDLISQLSFALPLIVMFFTSLLIAKIFGLGERYRV
ncbi:MAG: twin-arginine translocase subunit TatC [bacterium]